MNTSNLELQHSIVAILDNNLSITGTGFIASNTLIVTCAHVILAAGHKVGETLTVEFQANAEKADVRILEMCWRSELEDDIAVLQLNQKLPEGVKPLTLGQWNGINAIHPFRAFGYPEVSSTIRGLYAVGSIVGHININDRNVLQVFSPNLTYGMSGSPVYDEITGLTVGMISSIFSPGSKEKKYRDLAFAIPSEVIAEVCSELCLFEETPKTSQTEVFTPSVPTLRVQEKLTLGGHDYIILEVIAERNFGNLLMTTLRAADPPMQDNVGICQIVFRGERPDADKKRNLRRAQKFGNAANNSKHMSNLRNIVSSGNELWIISPWVNGPSLSAYFPHSAALPQVSKLRQLVSWCVDVCDALIELHKQHEMHLGVAADTIIIRQGLGAVLIDSGFVGRPVPMKSQQRIFDPKVDIYALASVLYRAATHRSPQSQTASSVNPAVPPNLDQVLQMALTGSFQEVRSLRREMILIRSQLR